MFDRKYNGKGYDNNGKIIYELIKGNGIAIEYGYIDKLIFKGEYLNGKKYKGEFYKY